MPHPEDRYPPSSAELEDWITHVLDKARQRRGAAAELVESGQLEQAQETIRGALAREVYVTRLRGEVTWAEVDVIKTLLGAYTGDSAAELIATSRAILANAASDLR